jgi:hypothetical protein
MSEVIAPAPPGVQSTFDKPLGPQPAKTRVGDKFREEFAKLTKPEGEKETTKPTTSDATKPVEVVEPKKDEIDKKDDIKPPDKPSSPLEAVLAKTPKEQEKVEEPDVLKEFDEKTANWQRAREVMKTQSGELKTLREKVQTFEKAPKAEPSVIESLTKERDDIQSRFQQQEEKLKAINYQYSDEYQGLIKERDNTLSKISSRVKSYGGDANGLIEALALPDGKVKTAQIKEALADVDPDDKPRIHALIETFESQKEKIDDAEKNAAPKWDELRSRHEAQLAEQSVAAIKQLETEYRKVVESIPDEIVTLREVPDDVPGAKEWNDEIRAAREQGLAVLKPNGADFNRSVRVALQGEHYPFLMKRFLALHSDYSELKKSYNEAVGAGPDFKGGGKPKDATKAGPKGAKGYHEALAAVRAGQVGEF